MDSKETCKICGKTFEERVFGKHLRSHKILLAAYYEKFFPKEDLYTGVQRSFKERETYFLHDFDSRANLIAFLERGLPSGYETYPTSLLQRHARIRNFRFAPSQVELRTSVLPARNYYEKEYGSYSAICRDAGLVARFEDNPKISVPSIPDDFEVWIDTREQTPLQFLCGNRSVKLDFADYTVGGIYYSGVFVERKSLSDLVSTIAQGYERFEAEIERAKAVESYIVVSVECTLQEAQSFRFEHTKALPHFIFKRIKDLLQKYDNIQFAFPGDRARASQFITEVLLLGEAAKKIDLQYALERKQLCGKSTPVRT